MEHIEAAIDAGIKAENLYETARDDIISRRDVRKFLIAAIAEYERRKRTKRAKD